ncbi:O-fucosyltransferase 16-like isoform X2 [Phragmites australis]|uniref:O-fucosyltransferase 16-like isoform X2 n=1 Tax=Phragmites australis TaxID=29695 RepID=UPI002D79F20C|nr:O-fucosyltransferase 16-like isoform X2 [Phragmites australis]
MGQPRRRGHPRAHHRCPRRIALPAAALALLFLAVSLLSVSLLSAPPLADRPGLASSSRGFLRRPPANSSGGELEGSGSGETHEWIGPDDLWRSKLASNFYGCSNSSNKFLDFSVTTQPDRYLIVVTSGGLNQQRTGVIRMTKYDYRLSNKLDTELQKLRCRVNYHALRFTDPIQEFGEKLIQRMREKGRYFIALHLRFEPDMLAFSGCYYGGGEKERRELGAIRKRWRTLHISDPEKGRRQGRCPLTPEEVGLMLRALGYSSDVHIYVASGDIYGGEDTLAPLKGLFPNFHTKETMSSKEELAPFLKFSSRMAAIDFIVCDGSDAFVANNNGNMAKILAGRRRYFGHKRTIRPNAKQFYPLFMRRENMSWDAFSSRVRVIQKGYMGEPMEVMPGRGEFHANPAACICEKTSGNSVVKSSFRSNWEPVNDTGIRKAIGKQPYPVYTDEEADGSDTEDDPTRREETIDIEADDDSVVRREDSELEEILSD